MTPAKQRLQSVDDGVLRLGPDTIHIDLTNACNTDCVTCWDHSPHLDVARAASWKRQRVDAAHVRALLDDAQSLGGLEAIILSGMGEPFTHPAIYEIAADVKRRGLRLTIITNLVAADVERVVEIGVDHLLIGVQGASAQSYLAFHPSFNESHWTKLHQQLAHLQSVGRRDKHVQVICGVNAHELTAMVELAARYDASLLNFKLASLAFGTEAVRIDDAQRARLLDVDIAAAVERARALRVQTNLDVFRTQVEVGGEATAPVDELGCLIGYSYARVAVDGTVLYCCNTDVEVGRLDERTTFSSLWRGAAWEAMRARMKVGDYFDSCTRCGKVWQNAKLSAKFKARYGEERWLAVTGRGPSSSSAPSRRAALRVLP